MKKLSPALTIIGNNHIGAVIETTPAIDDYGSAYIYSTDKNFQDHIKWGVNDDLPNQKMEMLRKTPNKMQLVTTVRDFIVGDGVGVFKETIGPDGEEKLTPYHSPAIKQWLRKKRINQYVSDAAFQLAFSGNVFTNISITKDKDVSLSVKDCFITRLATPEIVGKLPNKFILNPYFGLDNWQKNQTNNKPVPAFDPNNLQYESIFHGRDKIPGQPHYSFKPWWFSDNWTNITDLISQFHINGLKNGYNIKYHIRIPEEYYDKFGETIEEREKAKETKQQEMDKWLAGVTNVNKTLITHYLSESMGQKIIGVEIIELKNNLPDDAYTALCRLANEMQVNAHGLLPILGGISTDKALGGSGSELRVNAQYHEDYRTRPDREIIYEPLRFAADIMGWDDDIVFYSKRIMPIPTLDQIPPDKRKEH